MANLGRRFGKSRSFFMYIVGSLIVSPSSMTIYTTCKDNNVRRKNNYIDPILDILSNASKITLDDNVELISSDNYSIVFKSKNGISTINIH